MSAIYNNDSYFLKLNVQKKMLLNTLCSNFEFWNNLNQLTTVSLGAAPLILLKYKKDGNGVPPQFIYPSLPTIDHSTLQFGDYFYISSSASPLASCLGFNPKKNVIEFFVPVQWTGDALWKVTYSAYSPNRNQAIVGIGEPFYFQHFSTGKYLSINGNYQMVLSENQDTSISLIPFSNIILKTAQNQCLSFDSRKTFTNAISVCNSLVKDQFVSCEIVKSNQPSNQYFQNCPVYNNYTQQYVFTNLSDCQSLNPTPPPLPPPPEPPSYNNLPFDCQLRHTFISPGVTCGKNDPLCCQKCKGYTNLGCYQLLYPSKPKLDSYQLILIIIGLIVLIIIFVFFLKMFRKQ